MRLRFRKGALRAHPLRDALGRRGGGWGIVASVRITEVGVILDRVMTATWAIQATANPLILNMRHAWHVDASPAERVLHHTSRNRRVISMTSSEKMSQEKYWSSDGGDIWLKNLQNFESMISPIGEHLIKVALQSKPDRIVDIGCGGGATTLELAKLVGEDGSIIGVDISSALIEECRRRAQKAGISNIEFVCGDAAATNLPTGWAQLVLSRFGVMFFKEPVKAFSKLSNDLSSDGHLAFSCWAGLSENPWMHELLEILAKYVSLPIPDPRAPGPFAFADPDYISVILSESSYKDINIDAWSGNLLIGASGMTSENAAEFLLSSSSLVRSIKQDIEIHEEEIYGKLVKRLNLYFSDGGVHMPAKAWIVTASNGRQ